MIEIGDKVTFKPAFWLDNPAAYAVVGPSCPTVTGTVCYINREHHYYRVEYQTPAGCIGHECFRMEPEDEQD